MGVQNQHSEQPADTTAKAEPADRVKLAELDAAQLRDVMYARLQGNISIGPPVDPRVGKEPFEWLSDEFRRGSTSLQRRMTAVLEDFLDELTDTDRWPERSRYDLLDLIQDCGEQLLDHIHRLIRQQTFLQAAGLGPDVHAALLKVLISNGHHATPEFWLQQSEVLGPSYGALILSGLVDHGLDLAMHHLPQLSADDEARDYVRWLLPELQDRFGTAVVLEQLDRLRPQLPDATYQLYKSDLLPPVTADVTAPTSKIDDPQSSPLRPWEITGSALFQLLQSSEPSEFACLTDAVQEAELVAQRFRNLGFDVADVTEESTRDVDIKSSLVSYDYDVIHVSAHGVYGFQVKSADARRHDKLDQPKVNTGMVIHLNKYLMAAEISKIRRVPELVFLDCCAHGQIKLKEQDSSDLPGYDSTARIAKELIKLGVRAVVCTERNMDAAAALTFADNFYERMFRGETVGQAVLTARHTTLRLHGEGTDTWREYQCYGDPTYVLTKF